MQSIQQTRPLQRHNVVGGIYRERLAGDALGFQRRHETGQAGRGGEGISEPIFVAMARCAGRRPRGSSSSPARSSIRSRALPCSAPFWSRDIWAAPPPPISASASPTSPRSLSACLCGEGCGCATAKCGHWFRCEVRMQHIAERPINSLNMLKMCPSCRFSTAQPLYWREVADRNG